MPIALRKALPGSPMITFGIRTQGSSPNVGYTVLASKFDTINDLRTYLDTTFVIRKYPGAGKVESPFIGPAIDFKKLVINSTANGSPDSALLTVRGYATFSDTGYGNLPRSASWLKPIWNTWSGFIMYVDVRIPQSGGQHQLLECLEGYLCSHIPKG